MQLIKTINWQEPLAIAAAVPESEDKWVLLYSGMASGFSGRYSILALRAKSEVQDLHQLADRLSADKPRWQNAWFGYLGYGLKNQLEKLPQDSDFKLAMPDLWLVNYGLILLFDHEQKQVEIWADADEQLRHVPVADRLAELQVEVGDIASNMTRKEYLQKVKQIQEAIVRGDLYQANLTRKFYGKITKAKPVAVFDKLCQVSPAPYAAFMKFGRQYVISSSPERFLYIGQDGNVDTRPIKGSAPRFADEKQDKAAREGLANSEKDRAENLMIVDLLRNDLSRNCEAGSVKAHGLFEVTSYATVHHMASTVTGNKQDGVSSLQLVQGCFPPGSMTGAPKIKAMELCSQLEQVKRGVYSGALGYFAGDGLVDLSVVIRTLIIDGDYFEFQVGGAIVADSDPTSEWEETIVKATGISTALGIDLVELRKV